MPERQPGGRAHILVRAGSVVCALPIEHVVETMRPLPIQTLDNVPAFVRGVAVVRGAPTPVVDLARLIGAADSGSITRLVTISVNGRSVSLAVAEVLGVRTTTTSTGDGGGDGSFESLPPLLGGAGAETIAAIGTLDADLLLVLRTGRLLPESLWTAMAASETASS